jgi:tetratricopeptide (TPR) repeat protein
MQVKHFRALRGAVVATLGAIVLVGPSVAQQAPNEPWRERNLSFTGSYLSALVAEGDRETEAAAGFLGRALARDPNDPILIARTFATRLMDGDVGGGLPLARRLIQLERPTRFALMTLALDSMSTGDFANAETLIAGDVTDNPISQVTNTLLLAWIKQGQGDTDGAIQTIEGLKGPEWYPIFAAYQAGLISALAGRTDQAVEYLRQAYEIDPSIMRMAESYIAMLANAGQIDLAKQILTQEMAAAPHPILSELSASINAGEIPPVPVASPAEGAAEVLYTLGSAIGADAEDLSTVYLSLSLFADPDNDYTAFALAELMQNMQRFERSAAAFGAVPPTSPFHSAAQIRRALSLDAMDETDLAVAELKALADANPEDTTASITLADILSGRERFAEASEYYTRAIDQIETPETSDWILYYRRGITYERTDRWELGEADFFKALELFPDQPQVLNYLGYTWADKGINLDQALGMIQKAVDLRPNDGYIVDSLGWAHYMLGNYEEAVIHLERAVSLSPEDAILNDHLGDAYWRVGRTREAVFQWTHARDLGAEGDILALIVDKIANGLPVEEIKAPG